MRLGQLLGRSVVARDTATELGRLGRIVVDYKGGRATAISVGDLPSPSLLSAMPMGGAIVGAVLAEPLPEPPILLDWSTIVAFGPDAIVVDSASRLRPPASEAERQQLRSGGELIGRPLMSDAGNMAGKIEDLELDATGRITSMVAGGTDVPVGHIHGVGPFAVIVSSPTEPGG